MKDPFSSLRKLTRVFSGDKLVDSKLLNFVGIQVPRILAARLLYTFRRISVDDSIKEKVDQVLSEGILVWPNFLPEDQFEILKQEFLDIVEQPDGKLRSASYGPTLLETTSIGRLPAAEIPNILKFFADPRLRVVLEAAEKRLLDSLWKYANIQLLKGEDPNRLEDPQTKLHSDIWYNTHKGWFYLTDVKIEDGPFVYVKRSHRLSPIQLSYVYKSCRSNDRSNASRCINPDELRHEGLREMVVTCPRNTLVIANTCGYHRRLPGRPSQERFALHLDLRANPFAAYALRAKLARYPQLYEMIRSTKASFVGKRS